MWMNSVISTPYIKSIYKIIQENVMKIENQNMLGIHCNWARLEWVVAVRSIVFEQDNDFTVETLHSLYTSSVWC